MTPEEPRRIQRKRTKGWRMPKGAVYVGRPTKWGNPITLEEAERAYGHVLTGELALREIAVAEFTSLYAGGHLLFDMEDVKAELAGHDLACWCPLGSPCHADVLLELANRSA